MHTKWIRSGLFTSLMIGLGACGTAQDDLGPVDDAEALEDEGTVEATTRLTGQLLDTDEQPVADAEVVLVIGSVPVTEPVRTDAAGRYALDVPTGRVKQAWASSFEVTVLFTQPSEDREPMGTSEGDLIHELPVSLDEYVTLAEVQEEATLELREAFVPRQGQGFAITDELVANGGELTWRSDDSQYGENFAVTLIIEPGSIHKGEDAQEEITLTLIEQAKAPMSIPEDGFGPMWTIQPRDIVFDPPARLRFEGDRFPVLGASELAAGERTELFGASLETGWKLFGEVELAKEEDGRVTLETPEGIISHGAWGHIFNNTDNDFGMLVECFSKSAKDAGSGDVRVPCAVLNDNAYWYQDPADPTNTNWIVTNLCEDPGFVPPVGPVGGYDQGFLTCDQWDFGTANDDGNHMVYASDAETRCRTCGGASAPYVVAMTAHEEFGGPESTIWGQISAFPLCPEETTVTDMDALWDTIYQRQGFYNWAEGANFPYDSGQVSAETDAELSWRNFSKSVHIYVPDPVGCI